MTTMGLISRLSFSMAALLFGIGLAPRLGLSFPLNALLCLAMFIAPVTLELLYLWLFESGRKSARPD